MRGWGISEIPEMYCISESCEVTGWVEYHRCILEGGDIGGIPEMHLWEGGGVGGKREMHLLGAGGVGGIPEMHLGGWRCRWILEMYLGGWGCTVQ